MTRLYRSIGLAALAWLIGSCGGGADSVVGPPPPTVASVTVSRDTATLVPAAIVQLTAAARTASGEPLQRTFSWSTSDPAKAIVSNSGMVVGVAPGSATITATADGKSATATITVLDGGIVSSSGGTLNVQSGAVQIVVPADALASNTNLSVAVSNAVPNDPRVIRGTAFDFGPSGTNFARPVVLKVRYDPANLPTGTDDALLELYLLTGSGWEVVPQSTVDLTAKTVSAAVSHFSTYAILGPVSVATLTLSDPTTPMVVGGTQQLSAVTRDAAANVLTDRLVSWVSSNSAVLTVSATGLVTAASPGTATITATSESVNATTPVITVNPIPPPAVNTVTVTPPSASIIVGATQQLVAMLKDANNNTLTGRTIIWSSNDAAASVDANGLVTAVGVGGPVTITATSEGKSGTSSIAVTAVPPLPVATVTLSAAITPMVVGATQVLTASPKDGSGITLSGRTVTWVSSNTAVLTVSAASSVSTPSGATVTVTATGQGTATITATSEAAPGATTPLITVNPVPVATVAVSPASASIVVGSTQQLTATLKDANNNILTGRTIGWVSGTPAVATVDPATGLVTGVSAGGPLTIAATSEGQSGTSTITVTALPPPPVATVTLSAPITPMVVGATQQLTAVTRDGSGNLLTGRLVAWLSSNTAVLTVSASGLVTAVAQGTATVMATSESVNSTTPVITVNPVPPPAVNTVTVTPPSANIIVGGAQQLVATLKDANNKTLTGRAVSWTSNNAAASVDANGLVTAVSVGGPVTITATSEGKSGVSSITVDPVPVATVTLSAPTTPMVVGATQQLSAVTRDANNNVLTGRLIAWVSSNTAVLTVSGSGFVTAAGQGTATVTATSESKSATTPVITVNPVPPPPVNTVTVTPPSASIIVGGTQQLTAVTRDASGNLLTGRTVNWSSGTPTVATVDAASGLVTAVSAGGPVTITATSEGKTGSSSITVTAASPPPVATVTLSPATTPILVGATQVLTATPRDAGGTTLSGRTVNWISSNPSVLTVSVSSSVSTGDGATVTVTAVGAGTAAITATSETAPSATTPLITVNPVPVATVTVSPASASILLGGMQQLSAVTRDAGGNVLTGRTITWQSGSTSVATVDANGLVTAVGVGGPITLTATSEGKSGTSSITVTPVPVAAVIVSAPTTPMVVGGTQQLSAVTRDAGNNILPGRLVTWSSSNTAVLTVSPSGLVTAPGQGTATITATSESVSATTSLITVNPAPPPPVATVSLSVATTPMVVGATQVLTATPKDGSGFTLSGRTVNWVSSNTAVLAVSAASTVSTSSGATVTVTAAGPGTAVITATSETAPSATTPVITVNPVPVATVTLSAPATPVVAGGTQQLIAVTRDGSGNLLTGRLVTWLSSNNAVLTVSATGLVTAVGQGAATVTATSESVSATTPLITVNPVPVATVTLSAPMTPMIAGEMQALTATPKDAAGGTLSGRTVSWVSSNTGVLTVSAASSVSTSTGATVTITAAGVGTATITAASEAAPSSTTPLVTVNPVPPPPVNTVTVTPLSASLVVGATQQLVATLRDANSIILTGRTINWSSNSAAATVDGNGLVTAVSPGGPVTITASSEGKSGTSSITVTAVPPPPVATVTLSAATTPMVVGATQVLTATPRDGGGTTLSGRTVNWISSNPSVLTVSVSSSVSTASGAVVTVTAVSAGTAAITATSETAPSATTPLITVTPVPVAAVTISAPTTPMLVGGTQQLSAVTRDAGGNVLSGRLVTWESSNTGVLTVSTAGLVTAISQGPATITATSEAVSATTPLITVNPAPPPPVATVTVSPSTASIVVGSTRQLAALIEDAAGNVLTGRTVTWSSNSAAASVDANGLVTAVSVGGPVTITAMSEGKSGVSSITVVPVPVATITLSAPTTPTVIGATQVLTAMPKDGSGFTLSGRTVNWVSSNTGVLTVSAASSVSTSSGATVTVTATGQGTATVTATSEAAPGATTPLIMVNPVPVATVAVSPASASIVVGSTQQLTATLRDANNNILTGRTISWVSGTPAVATVDPATGLVTAVSAGGPVTITATSEGKSGTSSITVTPLPPPPVATVTLSAPITPMLVGATQLITAVTRDGSGNPLTGRLVTWLSSSTAVLTVSSTGLVTAVGQGTATITATSESVSATTPVITVNPVPPAPVETVTVTPAAASVVAGQTQQLSAVTTDASGNVLAGREITWSSANNLVATVDATGLVTAISVGGPVTITATSEGKAGVSSITIIPVPVTALTLSAPSTPMVVGTAQVLTATPRDGSGAILSGRTVSWVSSNTAVLTVSAASTVSTSSGATVTVTATGEGTATITATSETAPSATTPVITVNPVPVATVTVSPSSASIIAGTTQQLSAVIADAAGNVLTGRTVTWVSATPAVATVDASGLVTAVSVGGPVTITATSEGMSGVSSITVNPVPVATVTLSAAATPMVVGGTQQLSAVIRDAGGNVLTDRLVTWVSSNTGVLTVSGTGLVTAAAQGTATITATSESVTATTPVITVNPAPPPPVATVTVSPVSASITVGGTQQLSVVVRDAAGNQLTGRTISWFSGNTAVATVDAASGLVTAVSPGGPITITATSEGRTGTSAITVTALTLRSSPFITSGLTAPVFLTQPLNDGRIFVVEQPGRIRVVRDGVLQTAPFLNISSKLIYNGERGLLSVAFHPQYATNRFFYVYFTGLSGEIRIVRFTTMSSNPEVADLLSEKLIFTTPHSNFDNHNGGQVSFGPDGMLYAAFGDGGGGGDPLGNGQKYNEYLGGMIRIDVNGGDPYAIPPDNPFVGQANRREELWAKGLRNPWRYAFDPPTGLLYIADVGQGLREEVDAVPANQAGLNYGWNIMEGLICYNATSCNQTGFQSPVIDFQHTGGACSITGGYVYRGSAIPGIQGHYFYSDYCARWLRSFRYQNGAAVDQKDWGFTFPGLVTSFGQDAAGELYVMSANSIYKLVP